MTDQNKRDQETEAYLARIRRTITESNRLVEQTRLRMEETDRMLESQGLTREQVMNFRFTDAQREAVNRELVRRGMEPLEDEFWDSGGPDAGLETPDAVHAPDPTPDYAATDAELENRQRKFGMMMKPFQI